MKQTQHRAEQQAELLKTRGHMLERQMVELERHKESLAKSEQRLSHALDATVEGVWDWNIQTGEVFFSRRWVESLEYSAEDVPLHISFWENIVHPGDLPRMRAVLQAHLDGHSSTYECENRLRTKSGVYRWNLDRGKVVERDSNGKPLRMVGTDTDITERKQVEDALHEREVQLQETVAILEASRMALTEKVQELEMFHDVVVGRELQMIELEKQLAALQSKAKA
jgi:PAS domain S-box-containing protein